MAFDATAFRNQLAYGGARPNLYEVHVTFPSEDVSVSEKFTFMCRSASLPGMMVGTATLPYFGRTIKLVSKKVKLLMLKKATKNQLLLQLQHKKKE
jgi:hypothetical protein